MDKFKKWLKLFSDTFKELGKNDPLVLASSTAFFTVFSLAPIVIIIVNTLSWYFLKSKQVSSTFFDKIEETLGSNTTEQIEKIVVNFEGLNSNIWITIFQFLFFIIIGTNLFKIIRASINRIWHVRKKKTKYGFLIMLKKRSLALGIILLTGILFLLANLSDTMINALQEPLKTSIPGFDFAVILVISKLFSLLFITTWFAAIFGYMPDGKVKPEALFKGALLTAILFSIGKFLLEEFLINSQIDNIFETSTSVVLILLFIFYSSLIMYLGASFIKVYNISKGRKIAPRKYAERYSMSTERDG